MKAILPRDRRGSERETTSPAAHQVHKAAGKFGISALNCWLALGEYPVILVSALN
jgi:hypothetical protein